MVGQATRPVDENFSQRRRLHVAGIPTNVDNGALLEQLPDLIPTFPSADGKTLAAQRIVVVPAGTAFGGGPHYRFGDGRQGFGNGSTNGGAPGATAPAATGTQNV